VGLLVWFFWEEKSMSFSKRFTVALAILAVAALAGSVEASNMGFKLNKSVVGPSGGGFIGTNVVSVPFRNPYNNAEDVCVALTLTAGAGNGGVTRSNGASPTFHQCGGGLAFVLISGEGLIVTNPVNTNGILVGSHIPGQAYSFVGPSGAGFVGTNLYSIPYHTTNVNAEDSCVDLGLTSGAGNGGVTRSDGASPTFHQCGGGLPFSLVLGEGLIITNPTGGAAVPSHF
jgi:hypothetical protein